MIQQFIHKVIAGSQILIRSDPARPEIGVEFLCAVVRQQRKPDLPVVEIARFQGSKLFLAVFGSIHLPHKSRVQGKPVDVLLRKTRGVKQQQSLSYAVHFRLCVQAADPVFTRHIADGVFAHLFRQGGNSNRLQLCHVGGGIFALLFGIRLLDNGLQFFFGKSCLHFGQPCSLCSIQFFPQAGLRIGR